MRFCIYAILFFGSLPKLCAQNVGIGTTTPISKLTLQTPLNTTGFTHVGGSNEIIVQEAIGGVSASIGTSSNHPFRLMANNTGLLHLYSGGQVIVGTNTTPSFGRFTVETTNNNFGISHTSVEGNILATRIGGTSAGIGTFSNTNMRLFCNSQNALLIDAATGYIGIGTDVPTSRVTVAGDITLTGNLQSNANGYFSGNLGIGADPSPLIGLWVNKNSEAVRLSGVNPYLTLFNNNNYKGYIWSKGADDIELGTAAVNTNGKLLLSSKGVPYLTVNSNGQVSVAGPPSPFNNPAFSVGGNGVLSMSSLSSEWTIEPNGCASPSGPCLIFYGNGFVRGKVDAAGDWVSISDAHVKENFQSYKPVLKDLKELNVYTYQYSFGAPGQRSFGLIAQEVEARFPEIVSTFSGQDGKELHGIAYGKTGVLAIKAIQEQQDIIEALQEKITSLEKRLAAIEKLLPTIK